FDPGRGAVALRCAGVDTELSEPSPLVFDGERAAGFPFEEAASFAASSSSTPMASRPARVIIRLIERPLSSCRQTDIPRFERNSRISLRATRLAPIFAAAALFILAGTI